MERGLKSRKLKIEKIKHYWGWNMGQCLMICPPLEKLFHFIFLNLLYHFLDIFSNLYEVLVKDAFPFIP